MKFRKKPVEIEAMQLTWRNWQEICDFIPIGKLSDGKSEGCSINEEGKIRQGYEVSDRLGLLIPTLEGIMIACENDWIIKGIKGEFYPCKPDIFEMTYDPIEQ